MCGVRSAIEISFSCAQVLEAALDKYTNQIKRQAQETFDGISSVADRLIAKIAGSLADAMLLVVSSPALRLLYHLSSPSPLLNLRAT